jgi:peptidoglycan glycosyltransferase
MDLALQQRIRRLFDAILIVFLLLLAWQSHWHLAKSDWLFAQPTNRRLARTERRIPRGTVYDRAGERLAWSEEGKRRYAAPEATAAVLGYMDPVYGRSGLEGQWNLELAGLSRTFGAREVRQLLRHERPHGRDLVITLDLGLQTEAYDALAGHRGAIVVLEPATGAILALATRPTFNATTFRADYPRLLRDGDGALRHRATQDHYPPGSTMKVVTAAAGLMHDLPTTTTYRCRGKARLFGAEVSDYHGAVHGTLAMPRALSLSCNNYFAQLAAALPNTEFAETTSAFGFGARWWEKLPDPRMLPLAIIPSTLTTAPTANIPKGERGHMGFGQSTVVATPLQMAMVAAAVANDGTLMAPFLVQELRDGTRAVKTWQSVPIGFPLSQEHAHSVAEMMHGVVTRGTARGAAVPGLTVYGKTGTAQQTGGDDHAWFIGYAERMGDSPTPARIAFAILVERGGTGGRVAVPLARRLLARWAQEAPGAE